MNLLPRAVFFGDSYVGASRSYACIAPLLLGWRPLPRMGRGGTGFVKAAPDGRQPYATRLPELLSAPADVIVVQASGNDAPCDLRAVEDATREFLVKLRAGRPDARIVVLSGMWAIEGRENLPKLLGVTARVVAEVGLPFIDASRWLSPSLIGPDGAHPTTRGHATIAARFAWALRSRQ